MLFTSLEFLFLFLPIVITINFLLPKVARNYWLLIASLFFYGWGEPKFLLVMIFSIIFNYVMAIRITELKTESMPSSRKLSTVMLAITIIGNLSILFVFKYANFATSTMHSIFPQTKSMIEQTSFVLPIGISFFTFQALSYVVDVYRGLPVQKNPAHVGLYISLFPQLIAGPIVRYSTVNKQITDRTITFDTFSIGVLRFIRGFNKKVLLANTFAIIADAAWELSDLSVSMAWLGCLGYTLQIFFDFSGYSDMAIGLGKMLGFNFLENFNYPYISKSITEFWRRWHISLGTWFRDYVYFPLGGSRVNSNFRLVLNLLIVWLATGIWHGANWTFILWGLLYGIIIALEKLFKLPEKVDSNTKLRMFYQPLTLLAVMFGWVLFRSENIGKAYHYIQSMLGMKNNALIDNSSIFYSKEYMVLILAGILCSTPIFSKIKNILSNKQPKLKIYIDAMVIVFQLILFIVSISFLVINAHNPFIYFNF